MSQTKAHPATPLTANEALDDESRRGQAPAGEEAVQAGTRKEQPSGNPQHGTHERSHAAHLEEGDQQAHTKPEGDLRQGSHPGARRQP